MKKKAIYPGSFDPFTFGHMDIVQRALKIFDHIYIAIGENTQKTPLFSCDERKNQIETIFKKDDRVSVVIFNSLLVNLARELHVHTVVRGLRAVSDFETEFQMASINRALEPELESMFFMTSDKFSFLSSSVVKEIASMNNENLSLFVAGNVKKDLIKKFK